MLIHRHIVTKLALSTFLFTATASAYAQDATAVADRIKEVLSKQGMTVSWSAVNGDASAFTIEGVKLTLAGHPDPGRARQAEFLRALPRTMAATASRPPAPRPSTRPKMAQPIEISPFTLTGLKLAAAGSTDPVANSVDL